MKYLHLLTSLALVLGIGVFMMHILNFAALHDINQDYVSKAVLERQDITLSTALPDWSETRGEWQIVTVSYFTTGVFLIFNSITLVLCIKALKRKSSQGE